MNRKWYKVFVSVFLSLAFLFLAGCSVADEPEETSDTTGEETPEYITFAELEEYTIIRGEDADEETVSAASKLYTTLKSQYHLNVSFGDDYVKKNQAIPETAKEIVVGTTNRRTDDLTLRYSDYTVEFQNGRIFILGGSGSAVASGVKWFSEKCISEEKVSLANLPRHYNAKYSLEDLKVCGVALKEFSVEETNGTADDDLRKWIGTRAGIRKQSENGYVIRLNADKSLYLNEISVALKGKELLLSASAFLDDYSEIVVNYFKKCITERSGNSVNMSGNVEIELPELDTPLTDVRYASGSTKIVNAVTDKDPLSYKVGDEIVFACTLYSDNTVVSCPKFTWICNREDGTISDKGEADGSRGMAIIKVPADQSGFVRLKVFARDENDNLISGVKQSTSYGEVPVFTAGVNTSTLTTKESEPSDFDSFWAAQLAKVTAVDPDLILMTKVENPSNVQGMDGMPANTSQYDFYRIKIQTPSECGYTSGYLTIPKNAAKNSLGITVMFNGYGVGDLKPYVTPYYVVLNVCAHSIELGREESYYTDLSSSGGSLYNYCFKNNDNRDTCYFRTMIMRDLQAVRFIKAYAGTQGVKIEGGSAKQSLGVWNGTLRLYGGSQGAFQGIAVASLDHDVTDAYWYIPWMCDVHGATSEFRPSYTSALRYYDTVFFGKRIGSDVNVTLTMGLGDYICPPSGVIALYNQMNGHITMYCKQGMTHGYTPSKAATTSYYKNTH